MAPPSEHLRVELLDRLAARAHAQERQQGVQDAREPGKDHPTPEIRGVHQVLAVGFAYGGGVLGEQSVHIHITNSTIENALPGCEDLVKRRLLRNNVAQ
jgi:hypothetical protein